MKKLALLTLPLLIAGCGGSNAPSSSSVTAASTVTSITATNGALSDTLAVTFTNKAGSKAVTVNTATVTWTDPASKTVKTETVTIPAVSLPAGLTCAAAQANPNAICNFNDPGTTFADRSVTTTFNQADLFSKVLSQNPSATNLPVNVQFGSVQNVLPFTFTSTTSTEGGGTGGTVTAPTFTWLSPSSDFVSGGGTVTLRATATRNGQDLSSQIVYTVTCGKIEGSTWTLDSSCTDGSKQSVTATITDGGRSFSSPARLITVDASNPTVQITKVQQGQVFTQNPITIGVNGTDAVSGVDRILVEASSDGGKTYTQVGVVTGAAGDVIWAPMNGKYTLRATATDRTGRSTSTTLADISVNLTTSDRTAPSVTFSGLPSTPQRGTITVVTTATDPQGTDGAASGIVKVDLFDGGTILASQTAGVNGAYTFTLDTTTLSDGVHNLRAVALDRAGNSSEVTRTLTVDNTAPIIVWQPPTTVGASGSLTLGASTNDGQISYTVSCGTLTGSVWNYSACPDGAATVTATATDAAGNATTLSRTVTIDKTAPTIQITSPTMGQVFTTAPVTISATAADSLSSVRSISASIQGPNDAAPVALDTQTGSTFSTPFSPTVSGTYTVTFTATDAANNTSAPTTRSFTFNVTTAPAEQAPTPVLEVVGTAPYAGNMSVNVSGNFDAASQVDRMILQITDAKGVVDNSTYVTTQARATFSVDTTRFANGPLKLQVIAYTKSGLRGISGEKNVQVQNLTSPDFKVASPSDGATVNTPTVPVQITLTKRSADYTITQPFKVDLLDYRGIVVATQTLSPTDPTVCSGSVDSLTCNTSFDVAALPADTYLIRARTKVQVDPAGANITRPLETSSRFTHNTVSVLPPASTIRFPAITDAQKPGQLDSSSGLLISVSDNTGVAVVEARVVGPFDATRPLTLNGTTQCDASVPVAGRSPVDVLMLNYGYSPAIAIGDVVLNNLDIDGSAYVPDNNVNERYDLRVTVQDTEGNRNIQCIPVTINRAAIRAARPAYFTSTATSPTPPSTISGQLNYTTGTWTLSGMTNRSRVAAVLYMNGVQKSVSFTNDVTGSVSSTVAFGDPGTYQVVWLIEDMTTGIVTSVAGSTVSVVRNP
ncbi:hypothetical protein GCM10008960_04800 [Deinococcus sedimenti]|uniref:HYR domain-containing protein n=2 Tax=Deinococcus sedimenti TaxID=1867090 RepID=A0ABQ2RYN7_9DEIO|nr:hypothetical protein GCM10008960_04800 [Deinococcus sedimenti]